LTAFGNSFSKNQCNDAGCALRGFAAISVSASQFTGNAGAGNGGGAIYSDGPLAVSTSQFAGNTAGNGGAIQANGQLSVTYSTFSGNSCSQYEGGAVFAYGALTVSNDLFNGNTSANYGGAVSFEGWRGEQASINNAVFTNNSTGSDGGAIYNGTGGTMTINNSTVGVQGAGNSSGLFGGGIENDGTMSINGSTIEYNTAVAGGGIMHQMGPSISFSGDTIEYNSADVNGGGGGIYTVGYDPLVTSVNTTWAYNTPDNCESPNYVTVPGCTG
jgi:predicted outer membrane repeat protein